MEDTGNPHCPELPGIDAVVRSYLRTQQIPLVSTRRLVGGHGLQPLSLGIPSLGILALLRCCQLFSVELRWSCLGELLDKLTPTQHLVVLRFGTVF